MRNVHTGRAPTRGTHLLASICLLTMMSAVANAAAPKISGTPPKTGTVGIKYSFTPTASDADGNRLTFSIAGRPGFAKFDTATGRLYGVPLAVHARTWSNIVISVTDGQTRVSLPAFALVINPNLTNRSPTITGTPPTTARVGTAYSFTPTARDPEGQPLRFTVTNKPSWATFSTSTGRLSGTPTATGTFSGIRIMVSDGVTAATLPFWSIAVSGSGGTTNSPPTLTGTPPTSTTAGAAYAFQPTARDANNDPLTFSIANKPSWASFSTSTGRLSGTPTTANIGTTTGLVIRVSDGKATTSLPSFSLAVTQVATGNATLSWTPPTRNTDGSSLTNLAGYRILYGTSATALNRTIEVRNPSISTYVVENLSPGAWYFSVKSFTSSGLESQPSGAVSVTVR
jgi:hypothetical protein